MDWKECCDKGLARRASPDSELAKSLIESSTGKFQTANSIEMTPISASSAVSLYYDALRELLEAIAARKGYKLYNHECYTWFLKDILGEEEFAFSFDRVRKVRNSINYYGRMLGVDEALELKKRIVRLIEQAKRYL